MCVWCIGRHPCYNSTVSMECMNTPICSFSSTIRYTC
uniref:Uncharacterized protein n=1 Tax=Ciona intestinalis TaxID=7719 RepID=H2XT30_CIOIN